MVTAAPAKRKEERARDKTRSSFVKLESTAALSVAATAAADIDVDVRSAAAPAEHSAAERQKPKYQHDHEDHDNRYDPRVSSAPSAIAISHKFFQPPSKVLLERT